MVWLEEATEAKFALASSWRWCQATKARFAVAHAPQTTLVWPAVSANTCARVAGCTTSEMRYESVGLAQDKSGMAVDLGHRGYNEELVGSAGCTGTTYRPATASADSWSARSHTL